MKKIIAFFFVAMTVLFVRAQDVADPHIIRITGTRFTYPLMQTWINEYSKINPAVKIEIAGKIAADSADILIASHILRPGDVKDWQTSVAVCHYILLPVVNSGRPDLKELQQKGITGQALKKVFFEDKEYNGVAQTGNAWMVYKREKPSCSSIAFANHFGNQQKDIVGVPVPGDDRDLLAVVKKDKRAVTYNSPGIIYNLKSRRVVDSIAVIPIDLNENGVIDEKEKIYDTLDEIIRYTENSGDPAIPVDAVNLLFRKNNPDKAVIAFLQWVLGDGQRYSHEYGFLNLDSNTLKSEKNSLVAITGLLSCAPTSHILINK